MWLVEIERAIDLHLKEISRLKRLRVELRTLNREAVRVEAGLPARISDVEFERRYEEARKGAKSLGLGWISPTASELNIT